MSRALILIACSFVAVAAQNIDRDGIIHVKNGRFVDAAGRERIFHGVNVVFKVKSERECDPCGM